MIVHFTQTCSEHTVLTNFVPPNIWEFPNLPWSHSWSCAELQLTFQGFIPLVRIYKCIDTLSSWSEWICETHFSKISLTSWNLVMKKKKFSFKDSLTHIKRQIKEEKKLEISVWHKQKAQERMVSRQGFYIPRLNIAPPTLGRVEEWYVSQFYQPKTGHGLIGTFFEGIKVVESPECWWCGDRAIKFWIVHQMPKVEDRTSGLGKRAAQTRDSMAGTTGKKWLAELLGNKRAVGPVVFKRHGSG